VAKFEVRDFDGDLPALSAMARETWLEEYGEHSWPDLYQPALAAYFFASVSDPRFLVAAYDGARLVAFVANVPRRYRLAGRRYLGVLSSMLVARPGYQGAAVYLLGECLRRNQELGADFAVMTIEHNHRSWRMFQEFLRPAHRLTVLKTMHPLVHALDFDRIVTSEGLKRHEVLAIRLAGADRRIMPVATAGVVRLYRAGDLAQVLALVQRTANGDSLVRDFAESTLAVQLHAQPVADTLVYELNGAIKGFVNFTLRDMVSRRACERWTWVEFVGWEACSAAERRALLAGLWQVGHERGCIGILEWNKGYYSAAPLYGARFVPYPRYVDVTAWPLKPDVVLPTVRGVFEQVF